MLTIWGRPSSFNTQKVLWLADELGLAYRHIPAGGSFGGLDTPEFLAMNPVGQVPVVRFADNSALAQSNAIMLHLAWGSDLIPSDPFDRAQMFQWLFWEQYNHEPAVAVLRFQKFYLKKTDSEIDPALPAKCARVLKLMNDQLSGSAYFVGGKLSLADIALVAYTRFAHQAGIDLGSYPKVRAWVTRVEDDLNIEHLA